MPKLTTQNKVPTEDVNNNVEAATIGDCLYLNGSVVIGINWGCYSNDDTLPTTYNGITITRYDVEIPIEREITIPYNSCVTFEKRRGGTSDGSPEMEGTFVKCNTGKFSYKWRKKTYSYDCPIAGNKMCYKDIYTEIY